MDTGLHPLIVGTFLGVFGATLGSFLNVVICRLPESGQSIVKPRSRCPKCGATIRWYDNIPIISFLVLGRRCRACGEKISWRYPLVEALTSGAILLLWWRFGLSKELAVHFSFTAALIAITFIDLEHRIIPNEISLPGIVVGFACSFLWEGFWKSSAIGLAVGGGGLLLLSEGYALIRRREGMGMGDVKLLAMLGAWLGWQCLLFVLLFASVQGVLASVILKLSGVELKPPLPEEWEEQEDAKEGAPAAEEAPDEDAKNDDKGSGPAEEEETPFLLAAIPFGPFLALAAIEYLFLGEWFYAWLRGG